jgi:tetratricopeptide (TPR) repeat protein
MALLLLAGAAWALAPRRPAPAPDCLYGEATYREAGTALRSGAAGGVPAAYHLPASSLTTACLKGSASPRARAAWGAFSGAGAAALAAAAGTLAGALSAGAAAAAALAWAAPDPACHPQAALTALTALLALLLARWAKRPSAGWSLAVAAALGASFTLRSTLAFLPPLLAAWALLRGRGRAAFLVGAIPYVALLPWAAAHLLAGRGFVLFEDGQAGNNIVAGVLGLVGTFEGDLSAFGPGLPDPLNFGETAAWALRETLAHPRRALDAMLMRLSHVVGLNPALWAAAAWGFFTVRRRPRAQVWGLLAAYLVLVHLPMAVQDSYFAPLWPVLALLAAAPFARRAYRLWAPPEAAARGAAAALAASVLVAAVVLGGAAMGTAVRYGARARATPPDSEDALARALERSPEDPVLRLWRGQRGLAAGRLAEARSDFEAAAASGLPRAALLARWSGFLAGEPAEFGACPGCSCAEAALSELFGAEAGGSAAAALSARARCAFTRTPEPEFEARLRAPAQSVRALLADVRPLVPRGRVLRAPRRLAEALPPANEGLAAWRALAVGLQDLGDVEGSLAVYGRLASSEGGLLADKAVALALAGRLPEAKALLEEALRANPSLGPAALTLGALLEGEGNPEAARAVYRRALDASSGDLQDELKKRLSR